MTRGGRAKERNGPERRCIVTRNEGPKSGLIRFVVGPGGEVVPDITGRLPGRGMWVSASSATLDEAVARKAFPRAARQPVAVPEDLAERVESLLARYLVDLLALARRAGESVAGREKVLAVLQAGKAVLLMQASDGSKRERAEIRPPDGQKTRFCCLNGNELGMAFGRDRVIHAAVLAGGLAERIEIESLRLSGFRDPDDRQSFGDIAGAGLAEEGLRGKG